MTRPDLAARLKARALKEGAALAGVSPADPPMEVEYFKTWLAEGRQGTMSYMEKEPEKRTDLRRWYPDAKSVLVCAFAYATSEDPPAGQDEGPVGRLARYSVLPDYHPILKKRMASLLDWLRAESPGADGRVFIDTSPVLEKAFARYAGIGWMGKNTLLIHPRLGSYFFIAGLALNLELPADDPVPDHCGTCSRCIDACPTDAFPEPYRLDASRCVAYFTIEHRGPIPGDFKAGIGDWVFGCDICQEACPWNRFSARPSLPEFQKPSLPRVGSLKAFSKVGREAFGEYKKTPVERARWRGWMRNVLLAMGNSGDPALADEVRPWAADPDPVVAEQARESLGLLEGRVGRRP